MATGDIQGNLDRLRVQLRTIAYPQPLDLQGLREGIPAAMLPLLHHALLGYSRHVARYLSTNGYELFAKSDLRFVECLLKYLREEFGYRCPLTVAQIFSRGFAERKLIFIHDVIQICKRKHNELVKLARQANPLRKMKSEPYLLDATRYHFKENFPKETEATNIARTDKNDCSNQGVERSKSCERQKVGCKATVNVSKPLSNGDQRDEHCTTTFAQLSKSVDDAKGNESSMGSVSSIDECYKSLKKQIMDVADNMEKHLAILEGDVSRNTETLKAKLVVLEGQVHSLSQMLPVQRRELHSMKQTMPRAESQHLFKVGIPSRRSDENIDSFYVPPVNTMRDISNVHQNMNQGLASGIPGLEISAGLRSDLLQNQQRLSTQELIASVKARCNKTKELLFQSGWGTTQ